MDDRSASALRQSESFANADDLLTVGAAGESLFVINLCAANMPQAVDASSVRAWGIEGLEVYKLYQVSRLEDGRTRYRVRLGFFTSEADAEAVLRSVRGKFATAFTSGLCDEDLKHASGHLKKPLNEIREIQDIQRTGRYRLPNFSAEDLAAVHNVTGRHSVSKAVPPPVPVSAHVSATIARAANAMLAPSSSEPVKVATAKVVAAKVAPAHVASSKSANSHDELVEIEWSPNEKSAAPAATPKAKPPVASKPAASKPVATKFEALKAAAANPAAASVVANHQSNTIKDKWAAFAQNAKAGDTAKHAIASSAGKNAPISEPKSKEVAQAVANSKAQPKPAAKASNLELSPALPPMQTPTTVATPSNAPFHVAAGRAIPDHGMQLHAEAAAPPKAATPASPKPAVLPRPLVSADALAKLRAAAAAPRNAPTVVPTLDTTQTIRTLTKTEIEDANAPKWFVVQLAISDQPANLDTMPRLDIFEAYRLYSVAVMQNNIIKHALRLGFFSEKVSADAVMGYVKTFFGEPIIEQISDAEQKRFNEEVSLSDSATAAGAKSQPPQGRVITLEEKRPTHPLILQTPEAKAAEQSTPAAQYKTASKSSAPAIKRSPAVAQRKSATNRGAPGKTTVSRKQIDEARALGLSDTAIQRVERNPSLFSRLVGKLTK